MLEFIFAVVAITATVLVAVFNDRFAALLDWIEGGPKRPAPPAAGVTPVPRERAWPGAPARAPAGSLDAMVEQAYLDHDLYRVAGWLPGERDYRQAYRPGEAR